MNAQTIEIRPTWVGNMGILIAALQDGTPEGKRQAREELMNLARTLDAKLEQPAAADPPAKRTRRELLEERAELLAERVQTAGHGRRARIQEKLDELERELRELPIEPGEIFASSWGYDQTNVDFYRVVKLAGGWITLEKIAKAEISDGPMTMTGKVLPADPPAPIAEPFRRKLTETGDGEPFVRIRSYEYARPWDLRPKSVSHYA